MLGFGAPYIRDLMVFGEQWGTAMAGDALTPYIARPSKAMQITVMDKQGGVSKALMSS